MNDFAKKNIWEWMFSTNLWKFFALMPDSAKIQRMKSRFIQKKVKTQKI